MIEFMSSKLPNREEIYSWFFNTGYFIFFYCRRCFRFPKLYLCNNVMDPMITSACLVFTQHSYGEDVRHVNYLDNK